MERSFWFHNITPGSASEEVRFLLRVKRRLLGQKTAFQKIEVLDTAEYGRILVLDGIIQIAEADEFLYHEMLVHAALLSHRRPGSILVIGGGDGGVLRELVKYRSVRHITLVELDPEVIRVAKKFLPTISQGAFRDRRVSVRIGDGAAVVEEAPAASFDVIVNDSTEYVSGSPAELLFSRNFYRKVRRALKPGGIFATLVGDVWDAPLVGEKPEEREESRIFQRLRSVFPSVRQHWFPVPSFGDIYGVAVSGIGSQSWKALRRVCGRRWAQRRIPTRFFVPEIFLATAFFSPLFPRRHPGIGPRI